MSKKQYRYFTYRGFDINIKETTLPISGKPCIAVKIMYSDTQEVYQHVNFWKGETIPEVKVIVRDQLEEDLANKYMGVEEFIPYAETMRVRTVGR